MAVTLPSLQRQFSSSRTLPRKMQGMFCDEDTMYFVRMKKDDPSRPKRAEIEAKLDNSSFDKLHFQECISKAFTITLQYLLLYPRPISSLRLEKYSNHLIPFLNSESCRFLRKLVLRPSQLSPRGIYLFSNVLDVIFSSESLCKSLECLQIQDMDIVDHYRMDKAFSTFIHTASVQHHVLRILDLRSMAFNSGQTTDVAQSLYQCLSNNMSTTNGSPKSKDSIISMSSKCSISHLFFGGNDQWRLRGVERMCDFIKYNHNLECVGVDLYNQSGNRPFLHHTELSTIARFICSMANHPTLQRLEIHHIQTYTLKAFGDQFAKRIKGTAFRVSELFIQQSHQNTGTDPKDQTVLPAISQIAQRIPWLQILELKISVYCNLFEAKQVCKLLPLCRHLSGIRFHCQMGEMFSTTQIMNCVKTIAKTMKVMTEKNVKEGRKVMLDAIESALVIANDRNPHVDKGIAVVVLSFADICYGFDTGLLFFESTFLTKLNPKDRMEVNEWLWNNWKRLPFAGRNISDERYQSARARLERFHRRMQRVKQKEKSTRSKRVRDGF